MLSWKSEFSAPKGLKHPRRFLTLDNPSSPLLHPRIYKDGAESKHTKKHTTESLPAESLICRTSGSLWKTLIQSSRCCGIPERLQRTQTHAGYIVTFIFQLDLLSKCDGLCWGRGRVFRLCRGSKSTSHS